MTALRAIPAIVAVVALLPACGDGGRLVEGEAQLTIAPVQGPGADPSTLNANLPPAQITPSLISAGTTDWGGGFVSTNSVVWNGLKGCSVVNVAVSVPAGPTDGAAFDLRWPAGRPIDVKVPTVVVNAVRTCGELRVWISRSGSVRIERMGDAMTVRLAGVQLAPCDQEPTCAYDPTEKNGATGWVTVDGYIQADRVR